MLCLYCWFWTGSCSLECWQKYDEHQQSGYQNNLWKLFETRTISTAPFWNVSFNPKDIFWSYFMGLSTVWCWCKRAFVETTIKETRRPDKVLVKHDVAEGYLVIKSCFIPKFTVNFDTIPISIIYQLEDIPNEWLPTKSSALLLLQCTDFLIVFSECRMKLKVLEGTNCYQNFASFNEITCVISKHRFRKKQAFYPPKKALRTKYVQSDNFLNFRLLIFIS